MGSLKKDQQIIAKDVEGLSKAIDSAVAKVKVFLRMNICVYLRTVPTIVIAHTFCASPDTRISNRQCLLIMQGYFCAV